MSAKLVRSGFDQKLNIMTSVGTSETIKFKGHADMLLHFPSTWTSATLTWYSYHSAADEWLQIRDASGGATNQTADPDTAMQIPPAVFAAHEVRVTCDEVANAAIDVIATAKA